MFWNAESLVRDHQPPLNAEERLINTVARQTAKLHHTSWQSTRPQSMLVTYIPGFFFPSRLLYLAGWVSGRNVYSCLQVA